jgi:hypothetical protein
VICGGKDEKNVGLDKVIFGNEGLNFYFSPPNQHNPYENLVEEDQFSGYLVQSLCFSCIAGYYFALCVAS